MRCVTRGSEILHVRTLIYERDVCNFIGKSNNIRRNDCACEEAPLITIPYHAVPRIRREDSGDPA